MKFGLSGFCVSAAIAIATLCAAGEPVVPYNFQHPHNPHGQLLPQPPRVAVQEPNAGATQRYLILQPAAQGYGQGVHPSPYAYGWFGAASRGHYGYGRGYYDDVRFWKPH
ncbi:MAG: hypothetical protein QM811_05845 [Pirellulales bacterium]